jgi:hypothetical protein
VAPGRLSAVVLTVLAPACVLVSCGGPTLIEDPVATLRSPDGYPRQQILAIEQLELADGEASALESLRGVIWRPGFTDDVREAALLRLEQHDLAGLQRTIRQYYPRMVIPTWTARLSEIIADRQWTVLTPALVSRWAAFPTFEMEERERPEYKALARLHGDDKVVDAVFELFQTSTRASDRLIRNRCWELLHRIGERERLIELVRHAEVADDDLMLRDLRMVAQELDLIPWNGEEILWARTLLQPEFREYWAQVRTAVQSVPAAWRSTLEFRDLSVVVASHAHEPAVLTTSRDRLYEQVESRLAGGKHHDRGEMGLTSASARLRTHREVLTWGDLSAIRMALRAIAVPEVVDHLFDYADRDHADDSTEYGGVIRLDDRNRFEILEFPPRIREHDAKFIASQEMFNASYDALFHFHYHAQRRRNSDYAGPGMGDGEYANHARANCLVLTFVSEDRLNVDYYRHDDVVVDLGVIDRPEG